MVKLNHHVEGGDDLKGKNELAPKKILGVLGGMGPAASAKFLELMAEKSPVKRDQEHPKIIMLSDPQIPDRGTAILKNGEDPTEIIKADLFKLAEWGADLLAVPCNTAHIFIEKFLDELPIPLINIVESTVKMALIKSTDGVWFLSTKATIESGIYEKYAQKCDLPLLQVSKECSDEAQRIIEIVKANDREKAASLMKKIAIKLWNEKDLPILAACTELPLAYEATGLPKEKMVSSLDALASACIEELYAKSNGSS